MFQDNLTSMPRQPPLDRNLAQPLYQQLASQLLRDIESGRLSAGARLPSESELMEIHGISRITVRQAIAMLSRADKLVAQRGKGTFVAGSLVRHDLHALQGFYESLRSQGIEPHTTLVEWSPAADVRADGLPPRLHLPVRLRRLYSVDERPFAVVTGWLPQRAAEVGRERAARLKVYEILSQLMGLKVDHSDVAIRCERAPKDIAQLLDLPRGSMVLLMERQSFDAEGRTCEFMRIHIMPQRYEFRLRVHGEVELARAVHTFRSPRKTEGATA